MDIYVDIPGFWISMYGYAMDSRTRDAAMHSNGAVGGILLLNQLVLIRDKSENKAVLVIVRDLKWDRV